LEAENAKMKAEAEAAAKAAEETKSAVEKAAVESQTKVESLEKLKEESDKAKEAAESKLAAVEVAKAEALAQNAKLQEEVTKAHAAADEERGSLSHKHAEALEVKETEFTQRLALERNLRDQEVAATEKARARSATVNELVEQVRKSTLQVGDLQEKVASFHYSGLESRELAVKASEERTQDQHSRAHRLQEAAEEERLKLQGLFAKMELSLREQRDHCEREKYHLEQESSCKCRRTRAWRPQSSPPTSPSGPP